MHMSVVISGTLNISVYPFVMSAFTQWLHPLHSNRISMLRLLVNSYLYQEL